jgi:hypothetical protein
MDEKTQRKEHNTVSSGRDYWKSPVSHGGSRFKVISILPFNPNAISDNVLSIANNSATRRVEEEPQLPAFTLNTFRAQESLSHQSILEFIYAGHLNSSKNQSEP